MRKSYLMYLLLLAPLMCVPGAAHANPAGWSPAQIRGFYNATNNGSTSTHIVLVVSGKVPDAESHLGTYTTQFGLSSCTVANACLHFWKADGTAGTATSPANTYAADQIALDAGLQLARGMCPSCKLDVVLADSNSIADRKTALVTAKAKGAVVHATFGFAESNTTEVNAIESAFSGSGVALVAPTGDGAGSVQYPASSTLAFGMSYTDITIDATKPRGIVEALAGGRGNFSAIFSRPAGEPNIGSSNHNVTTSAVVGKNVAVYTGSWQTLQGTEIASSVMAGLLGSIGGAIVVPQDAVSIGQFFTLTLGADDNSNAPAATFNKGSGWNPIDLTGL